MNRDYSVTKFSFESFRNLKKGLGKFDAVVECNELAIREFLQNLKGSADKNLFIQDLSEKHDIRVDTVLVELFEVRIRRFYIMSVMQKSEQFFKEFKREYKSYGHGWINRTDEETLLDNLLKNVFGSLKTGISEIGKEVYDGFVYYRLIRNKFAHSDWIEDKRIHRQFNEVKAHRTFYNSAFHSISAPNEYEEIDFNDFILFSNIIKNIGYTLCELCKPNNKILAEHLSRLEKGQGKSKVNLVKSLFKLKNDKVRFENALGNLINSKFGCLNSSDKKEVIAHLLCILA